MSYEGPISSSFASVSPVQPRHVGKTRRNSDSAAALRAPRDRRGTPQSVGNIFAEDLNPLLQEVPPFAEVWPTAAHRGAPDPDRAERLARKRDRVLRVVHKAQAHSVREMQAFCEQDLRMELERIALLRRDMPQDDEAPGPSAAMRLAVHSINFSVAFAALPVGAAMATYSFLRGEDMRITGRLTALTGMALAVMQASPGAAQVLGF